MNMSTFIKLTQGAFIGALLLSGCQSAPGGPKDSNPVTLVRSGDKSPGNPKSNIPDVPETCQSRLQDSLCEALLFYYTFNQTFPTKLEDLIGYEGVKSQADLRCPISGKPYIYNPDSTLILDKELWEVQGGVDPKAVKRDLRYKVILYDAQPHGEFRNGIIRLIRIDDNGKEISNFDNPSLYVVPVPEDNFRLKLNLP